MENMSKIEQTLDENEIIDIRFYPKNTDQSAVSDLLDSAHKAITAYKAGKGKPYTDSVEATECPAVG